MEHLSEEALEQIGRAQPIDVIEPEAHLSVCVACQIRALEVREFNQLIRLAFELA